MRKNKFFITVCAAALLLCWYGAAHSASTWNNYTRIWGFAPDNVFISSIGGKIVRYNGASLKFMKTGTEADLNSIWGSSGSDVFAVGYGGTILHYDGKSWSPMASSSEATYTLNPEMHSSDPVPALEINSPTPTSTPISPPLTTPPTAVPATPQPTTKATLPSALVFLAVLLGSGAAIMKKK